MLLSDALQTNQTLLDLAKRRGHIPDWEVCSAWLWIRFLPLEDAQLMIEELDVCREELLHSTFEDWQETSWRVSGPLAQELLQENRAPIEEEHLLASIATSWTIWQTLNPR